MPLILLPLLILIASRVEAYPEFVGYKYSSCLTCHFNGLGNGPLNDYGRALWASEIAGRAFAFGRSEEKLGEDSGFLGPVQTPWWIKPGLKYRKLKLEQNPGGSNSVKQDILMQAEANLAIFFKEDQSIGIVGSYGYEPAAPNTVGSDERTSREHYLRWQTSDSMWWYVGKFDKPFGIRIVNHTAYSRTLTLNSMDDQAHGIMGHYVTPTWEFALNAFAGDLVDKPNERHAGGSMMFEHEYTEAGRIGFSLMSSANKSESISATSFHWRRGYGFGSALMFELGLVRDQPKPETTTNTATTGYYVFSEAMQKLYRGYHVFFSGQAEKRDMSGSAPDVVKGSLGFLMFPMQRIEFRIEVENTRLVQSDANVPDEYWVMLGQLHVSL